MTLKDCSQSPAIQDLYELGIVSYLGRNEVFSSEQDLIYEILLRASTAVLLSVELEELDVEDFENLSMQLRQFCEKHHYDFSECCYGMEYFNEEHPLQVFSNPVYLGGI